MSGVFELVDAEAISNRHVMVIDDVITTGSTMISCCQELQKDESVKISIFSIGFTRS